tara:strand:+ start:333 stop:611 length:279 start_codon:yes stop_codon:yes gene_type:complete
MSKLNVYKWSFRGTCPVDRGSDKYDATLKTTETIIVEDLLEWCAKRKEEPIFQEDWTTDLAYTFAGKVTLVCWHRAGVKIESSDAPKALEDL